MGNQEKYIKATRKCANVYSVTYSDDQALDPDVSFEYIKEVAKKYGYNTIHIDQSGYCPVGEEKVYTVHAYAILSAIISTGYGPSVEFDKAYENDYEFFAADDSEAIQLCEQFQSDDDKRYQELGATEADLNNAPSYVACLHRGNMLSGELQEVEV